MGLFNKELLDVKPHCDVMVFPNWRGDLTGPTSGKSLESNLFGSESWDSPLCPLKLEVISLIILGVVMKICFLDRYIQNAEEEPCQQ